MSPAIALVGVAVASTGIKATAAATATRTLRIPDRGWCCAARMLSVLLKVASQSHWRPLGAQASVGQGWSGDNRPKGEVGYAVHPILPGPWCPYRAACG